MQGQTVFENKICDLFLIFCRYKWIIDNFRFDDQIYFVQWVKEFQTIQHLQFFHTSLVGFGNKLVSRVGAFLKVILSFIDYNDDTTGIVMSHDPTFAEITLQSSISGLLPVISISILLDKKLTMITGRLVMA